MQGSNNNDIDFCCWGPFNSPTAPCLQGLTAGSPTPSHWAPGPSTSYPSLNMVDCSYNSSYEEWCYIPNAPMGSYYILLITNYSNQLQNIIFSQTNAGQPGAGSSSASLLLSYSNPICEGDTLKLFSPTIQNATYSWTGPNNFQSNLQNPQIPNTDTTFNGYYSLIIDSAGHLQNGFINIVVKNKPNVNTYVVPFCNGGNTQIIASGAATFYWPQFGSSSSIYYMSPAIQGNYTVIGTAANGCKDTATFSITPQPLPISDYIYSINNNTVSFEPLSIYTTDYYWEFGDGSNSQQPNPTYTFNNTGTYQVSLHSYNFCGFNSVTKPVTITTMGVEDAYSMSFKIIPNPNDGNFIIEIPENFQVQKLEIISKEGKIIDDNIICEKNSRSIKLNFNNLSKGLHFLKIICNNKIIFKKVIVD